MTEEAENMGQFVNADGKRSSVQKIIEDLLQEDVTYEFIAHVAQCPLETVKQIAAQEKKNRE